MKKRYESKTIVALIGLVVLMANDHFGFVLSESEIFGVFEQITQVLLAIYAIYGRVVATKEIK